MSNINLVSTSALASARGVSPQAIRAQVKRGTLCPALQTSGGYYLFTPDEAVEADE
jgi:DNA-binding transcriptional MerR regulator